MTKHIVNIPARVLHALVPFASRDPERRPLSGIHIERESGLHARTTLVATDARRLLAVTLPTMGSVGAAKFTIPAELAWHADTEAHYVHLQVEGWEVCTGLDSTPRSLLQGFPKDWRNVIPKGEPTGESRWAMNLGFLHSFAVAFATLNPDQPGACVRHFSTEAKNCQGETKAGSVFLVRPAAKDADFDPLGVLMGLHQHDLPMLPSWAQEEAAAVPQATTLNPAELTEAAVAP